MTLTVDVIELAAYIATKTGIDFATVSTVLEFEEEFLKLKGIIK